MYNKPIRIRFTPSEVEKQDDFKKITGMTLNAIADKSIEFFLDNPVLEYTKDSAKKIEKKTIFKERRISTETYNRLIAFCEKREGRNISAISANAISIYIDLHNT